MVVLVIALNRRRKRDKTKKEEVDEELGVLSLRNLCSECRVVHPPLSDLFDQ
jgi:hypothetical protein